MLKRTHLSQKTRISLLVSGEKGAINFWFDWHYGKNDLTGGVEKHTKCSEQEANYKNCKFLDGHHCKADGSSLFATEKVIPMYLESDLETVWLFLENIYREEFDNVSAN